VALFLGSQLRFQTGQDKEGIELLEKAAKKQPELNFAAAQVHKRFGNEDSFKIYLDRATAHYRERFSKDAKDLKHRLGLIQCLLLSNSTDEVIQIAEEGLRVDPTQKMKQGVVQSYLQVFDRLSGPEKVGDKGIRALERCLQLEPQNAAALERIANMVATRPEVDWKQLKQQLEDTLAAGNAPATVHVLLADGLLQRGEDAAAKVHLEQALAQRPDMLAVLNNLAWVSAFKEPVNLERADTLIDQALQIAPQHPEVRETRGAIYLKQKKYSQAIAALEPLLRVFPKRKELRLWIAEAYTELGDTSMAERYRKQADEIVPEGK
jgi:tetratricopeptide (TPR) repeat protein